jgi:hypothetical protein
MKVTKTRFLALAALAVCSAVWPASQANAISINIDSITKVAPNTPTALYYNNSTGGNLNTTPNGNRQSSYDSQVSVLNGGTSAADIVGAVVNGQTRYASTQTSDSDGNFAGDSTLEATANYQILFTVNAPLNAVYDLQIDTSRIGAFVIRDETSASGSNNLGAVNGTFSAPLQNLTQLANLPGLSTSNTTTSAFNQSAGTSIVGLTGGIQQFTLTFTWSGRTQSTSGILGGDESVILMGLDTRINGDVGAADDYPGTSGRANPLLDGHFVNVSATITQIVPEPSTYVLAGMSMLSLGAVAIRRKRRA